MRCFRASWTSVFVAEGWSGPSWPMRSRTGAFAFALAEEAEAPLQPGLLGHQLAAAG